jgi:hypothetical protein
MKNLKNYILSNMEIDALIENPPISDTQKFINELMNIDIEIGSRFIKPQLPKIVNLSEVTNYDFGLSDNTVFTVVNNSQILNALIENNPFM